MSDMEKEFIPYDRALRLKALGFNEPCFSMYNKDEKLFIITPTNEKNFEYLLVPTFSQAFRWFREKYDMVAEFNWHFPSKCYATSIYPNDFYMQAKTYEEAELACLDKLIEIVEQTQKEDGR